MNLKKQWTLEITDHAEEDLNYFRQKDKKLYLKCFDLVRDTMIHPEQGIGKVEKLKYEKNNLYSRRVNKEHRMVYIIDFQKYCITVLSFRKHYTL